MSEQRPKAKPVVTGEVKVSEKKSIKKSLVAKDAKTVAQYTIFDVLIPGIKKVFYDIAMKGLSMFMFGDDRSQTSSGQTIRPYQNVMYRPYDQDYKRPAPPQPTQSSIFDYDKFVFSSRSDAESVLDSMQDIIEAYGSVKVSDLYDMVQKTAPYTAENYGWKNISTAKVTVCSEGFSLLLPKAEVINK